MNEKEKKPNVFKRIKKWWKEDLTDNDRDLFKIAGIWFADGIIWGSAIATGVVGSKVKKIRNQSLATGYIQGQMDAYKEMAKNPYQAVDRAISLGEKDGTVKRIKF